MHVGLNKTHVSQAKPRLAHLATTKKHQRGSLLLPQPHVKSPRILVQKDPALRQLTLTGGVRVGGIDRAVGVTLHICLRIGARVGFGFIIMLVVLYRIFLVKNDGQRCVGSTAGLLG